ncbi:hypothetical protein [Rhizobium azibense]|uniref:Transcriptional regulator n=1 Tax=Rhizobium azibense TaxID=1136135 RepID=A0A4R3RS37_9HYPH|nr:hypothetical protein [Rhizobium azibense]TCU38853.1 transcriptional regulator [Rhizobium azibense]
MYQSPRFREDDLATQQQLIRPHPWVVRDAPAHFIRTQPKAVTGAEPRSRRSKARWKVSQNRPVAHREGVAVSIGGTTGEAEMLDLLKRDRRLEGNH